jgi:predicted transcriptional regulator
MKTTLGVKLDKETQERLKALGESKERSPHWLMVRAIHEYLDREESTEREKQEDLARWEHYVDTGQYLTHSDMKKKLTGMASKARHKTMGLK